MDCIVDDQLWTPEILEGAQGLFNWGPPPPPSFLAPEDLAELMTGAHAGVSTGRCSGRCAAVSSTNPRPGRCWRRPAGCHDEPWASSRAGMASHGDRLRRARRTPGPWNWLFFPGGPGRLHAAAGVGRGTRARRCARPVRRLERRRAPPSTPTRSGHTCCSKPSTRCRTRSRSGTRPAASTCCPCPTSRSGWRVWCWSARPRTPGGCPPSRQVRVAYGLPERASRVSGAPTSRPRRRTARQAGRGPPLFTGVELLSRCPTPAGRRMVRPAFRPAVRRELVAPGRPTLILSGGSDRIVDQAGRPALPRGQRAARRRRGRGAVPLDRAAGGGRPGVRRVRGHAVSVTQNGGRELATSNAVTSTSCMVMPVSGALARARHASMASQESQRS